ncbi:MAG: D-2-hydroxyacid dehydrogenase [Acidobacteria bacterium]|nr:D-2-hydroxyacid dehydrogenase [Acidobacteriota bacterium]
MKNASPRKLLWPSLSRIAYFDVPEWIEKSLRESFPQFGIVIARSEDAVREHMAHAEIFVCHKLGPEQFAAFQKLRWIHSPSAGVAELLVPQLVASDVVVTNARIVHAIPVAEHAIALMFALSRNLAGCMRYQSEGAWGHTALWDNARRFTEINGKTLGVIGLGAIGREIAARARALGMRVLAVKRDPSRGGELADRVYTPNDIRAMLPDVDFLVLAAPDIPETRHLIGECELQRMKRTAYLINISRGSLVDTAALIGALQSGVLMGAALDVTDPEPLPAGDPLWQAPNLIITHHMGSATERFWPRQYEVLNENLRRYARGEPLLYLVDKQKGY